MVCRADDSATLVAMLPSHCRCICISTGSFDSPYRLVLAWFGPSNAILFCEEGYSVAIGVLLAHHTYLVFTFDTWV